ncbi:hypothetical protein V6N12_049916 [Hibiscus sabdariffa]|uniref:Uncharacterized protein n=1 Tax=Hibiscus sabdariffa TaxID=183260 RepID=A0ABR2GBT6_9ROSI
MDLSEAISKVNSLNHESEKVVRLNSKKSFYVGVVADFNVVGSSNAAADCTIPTAPAIDANVLVPTNVVVMVSTAHDANVIVSSSDLVDSAVTEPVAIGNSGTADCPASNDGCDVVPAQATKVVREASKGVEALMNSFKAATNVNQNVKKGRKKADEVVGFFRRLLGESNPNVTGCSVDLLRELLGSSFSDEACAAF